jgi:gliding motility-associatede transport system auxiliary component
MRSSVMALLGLASLLLGWILMFVLPGSRFFSWIILAIGVALIAIATVVDFRRVRGALASGRGRFGIGTTLAISLFMGIVLLVNAISVGRYHRFDFTGLEQFTLTSQTKQALADLDQDVEIVSLFTPAVSATISDYARDLLAEYQAHSDRLTIRHIDPELQPDEARRYGLDQVGAALGAVVVRGNQGQRQILGPQIAAEAEHAFTSAILEVTGTRQRKVYFLSGHGEASIYEDYQSAADGLRDNLFTVDAIDLATTGAVPDDAAMLIIAGPSASISADELETVRAYQRTGGGLLLLVDPAPPATIRDLISDSWLDVDEGVLIDPASYVAPFRTSPLVPRGRNSMQLEETFFTGATAILPAESRPETVEQTPLLWTSDEAWLERSSESYDQAVFDSGVDRRGPFALGVFVRAPADTGDLMQTIVIGDSDFAANRNFQNGANSALFLTAVNWLSAGEQIISIDRKVLVARRLLLTEEQARFLNLASVGLLPLMLLIAGVYVWWRRRQS